MANEEKWYFTKVQLENTPSRRCGLDADKELSYRQQAANFIQDMGQRLKVTQLCINTAIVYMHRFYIFHSFTQFHRNSMAAASLFLAAKVEEQPRKLEHVITVAHWCLFRDETKLDTKSEAYMEQAQELVFNENVLLQTLGFDVAIDHPHTHVVRCCHLVRANKELAQTSYFMASNSLHLTTMCLQYKPTVVACFCIHLACKWSNWEIPQSNEGKDWFTYVDSSVSLEQLEQLTTEFLVIFDKCPSRLKKMSGKKDDSYMMHGITGPQLEQEPKKVRPTFPNARPIMPGQSQDGPNSSSSSSQSSRSSGSVPEDAKKAHHGPPRVDYREYKEKKAREAAAAASSSTSSSSSSGALLKDGKLPPHGQQQRHPPPPHHQAKRDAAKREMIARENAKREAMKQEANRRDVNAVPRPYDTSSQHHGSQESRDQRRSRDLFESAPISTGSSQSFGDSTSMLQKRSDSHHGPLDPSNPPRRSRELSESSTQSTSSSTSSGHHHHHHHGHHHPDNVRRDQASSRQQQQSRDPVDPNLSSNHHSLPSLLSSNQLKRPRDTPDMAGPIPSQSKRPREGTDPLMNMLDPSKRPREPTDSNHSFSSRKQPPVSSSQRPYGQGNRPQDVSKGLEQHDLQRSSKLIMEKKDSPAPSKSLQQSDQHSIRPIHHLMVNKSPTFAASKTKSPEIAKLMESRSRSPAVPPSLPLDPEKKSDSKRVVDILSRPSGHLFSPDDDREDSSLSLLDMPLSNKFESLKLPDVKSKHRSSQEKNKDSILAPPTFLLPVSSNSPVKMSGLPTTPTEQRKRKRTQSSSSSEPELVPVVRKLEDMPGFHGYGVKSSGRASETRDSGLPATPGKETTANKSETQVGDFNSQLSAPMKTEVFGDHRSHGLPTFKDTAMSEKRHHDLQPLSQPPPSIFEPILGAVEEPNPVMESTGGEHHRKKKKEKHGKKEKDKDRDRDGEKKHKHKKKEKDKDKEKVREERIAEPIRITIPKDKLSQDSDMSMSQDSQTGLKIKIPKERLKVDSPAANTSVYSSSSTSNSTPSGVSSLGGLKIKIGKEVMSERRLDPPPSDPTMRKQRGGDPHAATRPPSGGSARRGYSKQNGHPDKKVHLKLDSGSGSFQPSPGGRQ